MVTLSIKQPNIFQNRCMRIEGGNCNSLLGQQQRWKNSCHCEHTAFRAGHSPRSLLVSMFSYATLRKIGTFLQKLSSCRKTQTNRCTGDCGCEQKYKWHRLLAYDPDNDCKGIFMDWFLFPSCCVCRCDPVPNKFSSSNSRN